MLKVKTKITVVNVLSILLLCLLIYRCSSDTIPSKEVISLSVSEDSKPTVIIDAGHGGEDVGAIGIGDVYEKDLNLQISEKLGEYLCAAGYKVIYTRTDDRLLYTEEQNVKGMRKIYDLKNRIQIANAYTNAIFISIHMNYYGQPSCSGLQVYHAVNSDSRSLARSIQDSVKNTLQPSNKRTIKEGNEIYVLKNCKLPAILIECGFISNPDESKKLSEKEYQKELCFSILCGIIEYEKNRNQQEF